LASSVWPSSQNSAKKTTAAPGQHHHVGVDVAHRRSLRAGRTRWLSTADMDLLLLTRYFCEARPFRHTCALEAADERAYAAS
jgi:hypothetical protein